MIADAIEREIFIRAGIDHVWSLVSKAGFWIGAELHFETEAAEGELALVATATHGSFPVQVVRLDAPRYAAYRWVSSAPGTLPGDTNATLVEFKLVEQDGGVMVYLKESGFARLSGDDASRAGAHRANVAGWSTQLKRLVRVAEGVAVT